MGASLQLPYFIGGNGSVETRLPTTGFFNGARVEGDQAEVSFTLPAIVRAGVEFHPGRWNVEAAVDVELWSMHKEMRIEPKDVAIVDAPGINAYELGPVIVPRKYKNTVAASIGVEGQPLRNLPLRLLGGFTYETGAAPDAYLSTLTVDGTRQVYAGGLGWDQGRWRFEAMLSLATMGDREVTMEESRAPQLTPLRSSDDPAKVNAGTYKSSWLAAGFGASMTY
jgi:long-chain fatty acid transport protein